ncbi:MAG: spore cortex biosynthesis protein YabQ [Thermaerobacter sp.]|nr:spore cortex biosynthesis protein YabQ [Thermaerobacter sp.]
MVQRALWLMAVWTVAGMGLGWLATCYGALLARCPAPRWMVAVCDWLWFIVAGVFVLAIVFWSDWGTFTVWVVVWLLAGYGLWSWLAAPLAYRAVSAAIDCQVRALRGWLRPLGTVFRGSARWLVGTLWRGIKGKIVPLFRK